jgi:hypothetical protein
MNIQSVMWSKRIHFQKAVKIKYLLRSFLKNITIKTNIFY